MSTYNYKREYYATVAMHALIVSAEYAKQVGPRSIDPVECCNKALEYANALVDALKENDKKIKENI
jgi:hypothetical protein